ncbi:subtilisin family serine protease [Catenuloplanes nepalensis]|uniref:Subtilisin family serine protease n=1 Tax=Catenuloplanes nepalensis TaxID=587533 RepID=A0ABT9MKI1_9ACTN|nr:S8 family serine peptidase [Catenuloplanes nepalensis]MDP9791932.1 subtilisin family serine protease [Catenuloplanes nepalensis]
MRRVIAALSVSAAFVAVLPSTATAAPATVPATAGQAAQTVTLITGDRVTVRPGDRVEVTRGAGREHVRFVTSRVGGHTSVIPSDAASLLGAGRLDPRLFDITTLIEFGYDDRRADLPLIVEGASPAGARVARALPGGMSAVRADRSGETWKSLTAGDVAARRAGGTIWLDGIRKTSLDVSVPQIGAPAAWEAGFDGTGATVAVLDTGVDVTHPDLAGQVTAAQNFLEGEEDGLDRNGHGTHVASTIAGTGAASGGRYKGVAPGAKLLAGKVCNQFGGCSDSSILAGMQWAAEQGADVVNMSLGGPDSRAIDPLEQAVQTLTEEYGTLFVIAAGNSGGDRTVGSPASADSALAVGAVDRQDDLAGFSSRGPRTGDSAIKPEITAPGVDIVAAKSATGQIGGPAPVDGYTSLSGTSMATPHVAGAAAILAGQHGDWTAELLKSTLTGSAKPNPEIAVTGQGAGRVDVARAITQTVTTAPTALSFGLQLWPHADDEALTQTLTYRNGGTEPITLNLAITPVGGAIPAGLVTLSATSVTVPAGGTAPVTVTVDTSREMPDAFHGGEITATAGDVVVQTPFGVDREVESYDVNLSVLDRTGAPATEGLLIFVDVTGRNVIEVGLPETRTRLPKGAYTVVSLLFEETGASTMASHARFTVDGTETLTIDARQARPLSIRVPERQAAETGVELVVTGPGFGLGWATDTFTGNYTLDLGPDTPVEGFNSHIAASFARKDANGTFLDSPYHYSVFYLTEGGFFTGFDRTVRQRELATVQATHGKQATTANAGAKGAYPLHPATFGGFFVLTPYSTLPFSRTEYYNADHGVEWIPVFAEFADGGETATFQEYGTKTAYEPGRTVREQWNRAVFGPAFPNPGYTFAGRFQDIIFLNPPLFGDGAGREGYTVEGLGDVSMKLYRDGQLVGESTELYGEFQVPPEKATYRVDVTAARGAPHRLSTSVAASWTFTSQNTGGDVIVPLPLSAVVFTPPVDATSVAPKGRTISVPLTVDVQEGSAAARNRSLSVEASFDDGATWQRVRVRDGAAQLRHPNRAGFVSLRATAVDRAGNAVTETIIRAYEIR